MSKDIIVLTPTGRRQKVQCTPNTTMLQILEDVCQKHGFLSSDYDLKHHKNILDLTSTIRFSNLPNKACLEMVEAERRRLESAVTVGLTLEDGDRRTADFLPNVSLYEIASSLAPHELQTLDNPTIMYMRQEVIGLFAMKEKTLKHLGLFSGRAILRLLNKSEEQKQANVSSVYRTKPHHEVDKSQVSKEDSNMESLAPAANLPSTSATVDTELKPDIKNFYPTHHSHIDPLDLIRQEKIKMKSGIKKDEEKNESASGITSRTSQEPTLVYMETNQGYTSTKRSSATQESLERRIKIEEEVMFVGSHKAIVFKQPDEVEDELEDLPDDFYDLSVEEVRKLYRDLQNQRSEMENAPLLIASKKEALKSEVSEQKLKYFKNAVVRIQFPDQFILQGVFSPTETIQDVINFIKEHMLYPEYQFQIFVTPLKETLNPDMTLFEAKFVPCVHMHFKYLSAGTGPYMKQEIYNKLTPPDAAMILASKYRSPSKQKIDEASTSKNTASTSKANTSKVPRWFR